jgi:hypothetical protein
MAEIKLKCFSCQTDLRFTLAISRRDECPKCRADVRVCKNCHFYDPKAYNECRETSAEVVREKDRATLCDYFQPGDLANTQKSRDDLLAAAEALFKKNV